MTVTVPWTKTQAGFAIVGAILAVALIVTALEVGRNLGQTTTITRTPKTCAGIHGFDLCMNEVVASQGAVGASSACEKTSGKEYLCNVNVGFAGCFWVTAYRTREGFPVSDTVAQRQSC